MVLAEIRWPCVASNRHPISTFISYQVWQWNNTVNEMTTKIILLMVINIMVFLPSVWLEISIAHWGFVATVASILCFYRGIAWELISHCGCEWLWKIWSCWHYFWSIILISNPKDIMNREATPNQILFGLLVVPN